MAGLEPANEGVKVPCLTAWLHPYWEERAGIKSHPSLFVGWVKGLEPSTPGTTIRCSNQLSYTHHIYIRTGKVLTLQGKMARQKGLEPLAYCLEGSCSIQLSYWRVSVKLERVTGIEPASPAWKAGALAIVLHPRTPSAQIVSSIILAHTTGICQEKKRNSAVNICESPAHTPPLLSGTKKGRPRRPFFPSRSISGRSAGNGSPSA